MSTTAIINPVEIITQLAAIQLTDSIVDAATSKKPRKSTKAVVETSLVDQINAMVQSNSLDEIVAENLTRIFGREFVIDVPETVSTVEPKEPKEKKPRSRKVKNIATVETDVAEAAEPKAPKEKKSRAKKEAIEETPVGGATVDSVSVAATDAAAVPVEPKAKKTRKPKTAVPLTEAVAESNQKEEIPKEKKARKPKNTAAVEPAEATSEATVVVKEKKQRKPKVVVERPITPILFEEEEDDEEKPIELTNPVKSDKVEEELDFSGFDAELVEEELSDIEEE